MSGDITGATRLLGLLGWPVAHSKSPRFQNAALEALGLDWRYVPLPTPPHRLEEALRGLGAMGFVGANVTIPHKEAAAALMDALHPDAVLSGAINTVAVEGTPERPRLVGHATDGPGFVASLREETGVNPAGATALLLGAGGAARGVAAALARAGAAHLLVANRTPVRAAALVTALEAVLPAGANRPRLTALSLERRELASHLPGVDLVVQATSVGMTGGPDPGGAPPVDLARLPRTAVVADLVYVPAVTPLLAAATAAGLRTLGGAGMLLHQGALALELWTGRPAPMDVMRRALDAALVSPRESR